jgi:hypothetical protein
MVITEYTYEQGKIIAENLRKDVDKWDCELKKFPRDAMGLTPNDVKESREFKHAMGQFDYAFAKLRLFNAGFTRRYKREMLAEHKKKREMLAKRKKKRGY